MEQEIKKLYNLLALSYAAVILVFTPLFFYTSAFYRKDMLERGTYVLTFLLFIMTAAIFIGYFAYISRMKKIDNSSVYNGRFSYNSVIFLAIISTAGQASFIFTGDYLFAAVVLITLPIIISKLYTSRILIGQNYIVRGFKKVELCSLKCIRNDENSGAVIEFNNRKPMKVKIDKESLDFINVMLEQKYLFQELCVRYGIRNEV